MRKTKNHNININIYNGIFAAIALNLVNPYYAKFAQRLGATDYQIAYLNSWPAFVSIFVLIPGALILETFGEKLRNTRRFMLFHKLFYITLAFIPFLPTVHKPMLFIALVGLMNFPGSIATMGYQSCIGDIFLPAERSRAMSLRNKYSDVFRLIITFASGQLLTTIPATNEQAITLYQIFFAIAFLFGLLEVMTFGKFQLPKADAQRPSSQSKNTKGFIGTLKEGIHYVKTSRKFQLFFACSLIFHFGWQMGWPIFNIYTIKTLKANEIWLAAISIASGLSSILTASLWGKFADKYGYTLSIVIATFGMSITPFLYVMSSSLYLLVLFNIIIGVSITGTVLFLFNMLLEVTPSENRTTILSLYNTMIALSATIAPLIGVAILNKTSIHTTLIIVGCLRLLGCMSFYVRKKFFGALA